MDKIKKGLPEICIVCRGECEVGEGMHILNKNIWPEHYTDPRNLGRGHHSCHDKYDNDLAFRKKQIHLFKIAQSIDPLAANQYFDV